MPVLRLLFFLSLLSGSGGVWASAERETEADPETRGTLEVKVTNLYCKSCVPACERLVGKVEGVKRVYVGFVGQVVLIEEEPGTEVSLEAVEKALLKKTVFVKSARRVDRPFAAYRAELKKRDLAASRPQTHTRP